MLTGHGTVEGVGYWSLLQGESRLFSAATAGSVRTTLYWQLTVQRGGTQGNQILDLRSCGVRLWLRYVPLKESLINNGLDIFIKLAVGNRRLFI